MVAHSDCVARTTGSDSSGLLAGSTGSECSTVAQMVEQVEQIEQVELVAVTIALDLVSCLICCLVVGSH